MFTYLSMSPEHVQALGELAADGRDEALVEGREDEDAHGQTFFRFLLMLTSDLNSYFDNAVDQLTSIKQDLAWQDSPSFDYLQDPQVLNAEAGKLIQRAEFIEALLGSANEVHGGGGDREMTAAVAQLEKARDGDAAAQEKAIPNSSHSFDPCLLTRHPGKVIAARKKHLEFNEMYVTGDLESVSQDLKILVQLAEVKRRIRTLTPEPQACL